MTAPPLTPRTPADANFPHCVTLIGPMTAWAETLKVGHVIESDDLNMIALPVEIALAFIAEHATADTELGAAARKCAETLALFRSTYAKPVKPREPRRRKQADIFEVNVQESAR